MEIDAAQQLYHIFVVSCKKCYENSDSFVVADRKIKRRQCKAEFKTCQ